MCSYYLNKKGVLLLTNWRRVRTKFIPVRLSVQNWRFPGVSFWLIFVHPFVANRINKCFEDPIFDPIVFRRIRVSNVTNSFNAILHCTLFRTLPIHLRSNILGSLLFLVRNTWICLTSVAKVTTFTLFYWGELLKTPKIYQHYGGDDPR